jgi:stage II sporulation protein D
MKSMYKFRWAVLVFLIGSPFMRASTVDIRLLTNLPSTAIVVSVVSGKYVLTGDQKTISDTLHSAILEFLIKGDSIIAKTPEHSLGTFKTISIIALQPSCSFKLKSIVPMLGARSYDDNLRISKEKDKGQFLLINHVDLEKYVAGVVEAESGSLAADEFYKVQSILCRTYALSAIAKHASEGFNLCDQVHCQAFKGRAKDHRIALSSLSTKDLVAVDNEMKLISTTFCSNCGGQTVNSEDIWGKASPCLKSVKDSFCIHMPHAKWERKISIEDWRNYLEMKHKFPVHDSVSFSYALNNEQLGRSVYFTDNNLKIPLKSIRSDFQLKSTFFSVEQRKDSVIFKGKGYGHGVGLCQEGAMHMAKIGYTYKEILSFYYRNINLVNLDSMEFFRDGQD